MKSSTAFTHGAARAAAGLVASLLLAAAALVAGCDRRVSGRAAVAGEADTLANGLPRALAPELQGWVECWRAGLPGFAPDSLVFFGRGPYQFQSGHPGEASAYLKSVSRKALILARSPDSLRVLDFDRYLDVDDGEGGYGILREPDSSPVLLDLASDSLWIVDFCGTSCFYDGGYWVDSSRFVLAGGTRSGDQLEGPWQVFLQIYDLRTQQCSRWMSRPVDDEHFALYQAASESALLARITRARSQAVPAARTN